MPYPGKRGNSRSDISPWKMLKQIYIAQDSEHMNSQGQNDNKDPCRRRGHRHCGESAFQLVNQVRGYERNQISVRIIRFTLIFVMQPGEGVEITENKGSRQDQHEKKILISFRVVQIRNHRTIRFGFFSFFMNRIDQMLVKKMRNCSATIFRPIWFRCPPSSV